MYFFISPGFYINSILEKIWLMPQVSIILNLNTKHLMTSPKGNSEFCFPKTLNVGLRGNKTHYFPWDQSLSVLLYLPTQK